MASGRRRVFAQRTGIRAWPAHRKRAVCFTIRRQPTRAPIPRPTHTQRTASPRKPELHRPTSPRNRSLHMFRSWTSTRHLTRTRPTCRQVRTQEIVRAARFVGPGTRAQGARRAEPRRLCRDGRTDGPRRRTCPVGDRASRPGRTDIGRLHIRQRRTVNLRGPPDLKSAASRRQGLALRRGHPRPPDYQRCPASRVPAACATRL